MRINSELTKQTQRSKCSIFNTFSMLIPTRSSAGRPIKCQGAPSRRGVPTGSTIITPTQSKPVIIRIHHTVGSDLVNALEIGEAYKRNVYAKRNDSARILQFVVLL